MRQKLASIDVGSYTARMLVALKEADRISYITRMREYINIADYFEEPGIIKKDAIVRTIEVMKKFVLHAHKAAVSHIFAVGTGLIRSAINRDEFISCVKEATGIEIIPLSGEKEALLTAEGVIYSLKLETKDTFTIVDIGGGSTEFFIKKRKENIICSVPIGAAILHNKYIFSDPPSDSELYKVSDHVKVMLQKYLPVADHINNIIGTGGTITSLTALVYGISLKEILPENISNKVLKYNDIELLFNKMKKMNLNDKINFFKLDRKRAKVIVTGTIILMRIMELFSSEYITASLSDLLEGIIIKPQIIKGGEKHR